MSMSEIQRRYYRPPCRLYSNASAGGISFFADGSSAGTCSANVRNNPFTAFDFVCRYGVCVSTTGLKSATPDGLCCAMKKQSASRSYNFL